MITQLWMWKDTIVDDHIYKGWPGHLTKLVTQHLPHDACQHTIISTADAHLPHAGHLDKLILISLLPLKHMPIGRHQPLHGVPNLNKR